MEERDVRGTTMNFQRCMGADNTGAIEIGLWADLVDKCQEQHTYKFEQATVRRFNETILSAGEKCIIKEIEDIGEVNLQNTHYSMLMFELQWKLSWS